MANYIDLLKREVVPAFGCTEPIALALAAARVVTELGVFPERLEAVCSGNIIKNAKSVTIPNSEGKRGFEYSLILGALAGHPERELEVLESITGEDIQKAEELYAQQFCQVTLAEGVVALYIDVRAIAGPHSARVVIKDQHTQVVLLEKDGKTIYEEAGEIDSTPAGSMPMDFNSIYEFAAQGDLTELHDLLDRQMDCNMAIAKKGIAESYGSNIGKLILENATTVQDRAKAMAAAASDARMGGCSLPVMINCGSGNQGVTLAVPIAIYGREYHIPQERIYRALTLANLLALYVKQGIGRLSAYCGVVSAAAAAVAGIAFLIEEPREIVEQTLSNALASASGVICDGAKASCAMKIALSLDNAFLAWKQARSGNSFRAGDGIVKSSIDETVAVVGEIAREGMRETDIVVLKKMLAP